jgi:hypothetical protein
MAAQRITSCSLLQMQVNVKKIYSREQQPVCNHISVSRRGHATNDTFSDTAGKAHAQ